LSSRLTVGNARHQATDIVNINNLQGREIVVQAIWSTKTLALAQNFNWVHDGKPNSAGLFDKTTVIIRSRGEVGDELNDT
jgi:hypothetical protein